MMIFSIFKLFIKRINTIDKMFKVGFFKFSSKFG